MVKVKAEKLNIYYGKLHALKEINLEVQDHEILSIIGPANSGKSTFLKAVNRLNDLIFGSRMEGKIYLDGQDIYQLEVELLRRRVGMVFALPIALPLSIFENIAYGPRLQGINRRDTLAEIVEKALKAAYLWDEVKDRLDLSALKLSGGQQQRLCIARTLAVEPEVILYDEPCSGLDPISTLKVEEAMRELKKNYAQVLVTNNVKQAARVSDRVAFFLTGELIEIGSREKIFTAPSDKRTDDYISGRFG